ncbi:hypothetical protein D3C76_493850 [compost metagenome]
MDAPSVTTAISSSDNCASSSLFKTFNSLISISCLCFTMIHLSVWQNTISIIIQRQKELTRVYQNPG